MAVSGNEQFLREYAGYGFLLAYLRNLPEIDSLYRDYCFKHGSRGRGNGQIRNSPIAGSNIWLADINECILIYQIENGRGPLAMIVYSSGLGDTKFLSTRVSDIIKQRNLPFFEPDLP